MKTSHPISKNETGAALVAIMVTIFALLILVGVALNVTQGVVKQTDGSRDYSNLRFETEGALETAYGMWLKVAGNKYGPPNPSDFDATIRGPSPTAQTSPFNFPYAANGQLKIDCTDEYGAPQPSASPLPSAIGIPVSLKDYPGWTGYRYSYTASVRLANSGATTAKSYGLKRTINYESAPLFQAMAFFNDDIELYKPATMIIAGLVHTNSSAFMSSGSSNGLTFSNNVSYVENNGFHTTDQYPTGATAWNNSGTNYVPVFSNGGQNSQVSKVNALDPLPLGNDPTNQINTGDTNTNNDSMRELIEPPDTNFTDPGAFAGRRLYNRAGIVVKISGSASVAANITVSTNNGVSLTPAQVTAIKGTITAQTITDRRENKTVDVSTVDVGTLKTTLSAASGFSTNGVLYIYDTSSTGVNDPKAIRLKNGGILPSTGLTVVSEDPIYIQGDYNTGSTSSTTGSVPSNNGGNASNNKSPVIAPYVKAPSAVICDAVTILSNSWNDSNSASALTSRLATHTTVNTAIVTGNIPSGWDPDNNSGTNNSYGYSGGLNNFPRFLEDWGNDSFTYFGSMVQLFTSKIFTGEWDTGNIYVPPTRAWNFDSAFLANPPPGSLDVVTRTRGVLVRY